MAQECLKLSYLIPVYSDGKLILLTLNSDHRWFAKAKKVFVLYLIYLINKTNVRFNRVFYFYL